MTKAAALALLNALEAAGLPASATLSFTSPGVSSWQVNLSPAVVYTGAQVEALVSYCAAHSLTVTAQFSELGIV